MSVTDTWTMYPYPGVCGRPWLPRWGLGRRGTAARVALLTCAGTESASTCLQAASTPSSLGPPSSERILPGCGSRGSGSPRTCLRVLTPVRRWEPAACPWARAAPCPPAAPTRAYGPWHTFWGRHMPVHICAHMSPAYTPLRRAPGLPPLCAALSCAFPCSPAHMLPCSKLSPPPCNPPPPPQNPGRLKCCNIVAA